MWPNPQETTDFVTFTEEILNGKLHVLCSYLQVNLDFLRLHQIPNLFTDEIDKAIKVRIDLGKV